MLFYSLLFCTELAELVAPGFQTHVTGLGFEAKMTDAALELELFEFGAGQHGGEEMGGLCGQGLGAFFSTESPTMRMANSSVGRRAPARQIRGLACRRTWAGPQRAWLSQRVRWSWPSVPSSSHDKLVTVVGPIEFSK